MFNKKRTCLLPVRVISVISKYVNHHSSCSTCIICGNNQNESMNGNQQGIAPSELMSLCSLQKRYPFFDRILFTWKIKYPAVIKIFDLAVLRFKVTCTISFPPKNSPYKNVWPMSNQTTDGLKLIIGTQEFNYLVTASIRVDCTHSAEVGPQTKLFVLDSEEKSKSVKIFIDHEVYEQAKILGQNPDCNRVEESNSLYQLRQIRSKFDEIETYHRIRASFDIMDITNDQPISIFTLGNYGTAIRSEDKESWANYILGSKLFMKIASEVFAKKYKAVLEKDIVESFMLRFKNDTQEIPKIMKEILDLFGIILRVFEFYTTTI